MTIDTSKIRPGDTGTIRVTFESAVQKDRIWVGYGEYDKYTIPISAIASHTPAPWVPEKGDVVWWNGKSWGDTEWEVLAVNGRFAWVGLVGDPDHNFPCLHCNLTLIRKGAA